MYLLAIWYTYWPLGIGTYWPFGIGTYWPFGICTFGYLVYLLAIWYRYLLAIWYRYLLAIWYIVPRKTGNPALMNLKVFANRNDSKGKKPFSGKKME
jgi:hypothetical protein